MLRDNVEVLKICHVANKLKQTQVKKKKKRTSLFYVSYKCAGHGGVCHKKGQCKGITDQYLCVDGWAMTLIANLVDVR